MLRIGAIVLDSNLMRVWVGERFAVFHPVEFSFVSVIWRGRGKVVPMQKVYHDVYGLRPECDQPHERIFSAVAAKARVRLRPLGVTIFGIRRTGGFAIGFLEAEEREAA